jgi:hypothetical protein
MAYYSRTTTGATNLTKFTLSFWLKRGDNDTGIHQVWSLGSQTSNEGYCQIRFNDDNGGATFRVSMHDGGSDGLNLFSKKKLMDSQWYHFVIRLEMGNTSANKLRVYMNGDEMEWDTSPSLDYLTGSSLASTFFTGGTNGNINIINAARDGSQSGDHHYAEMYFVDGQDLAASAFAEADATTGRWRAKSADAVRTAIGNFGNNGYYLSFQDDTSLTTLGRDYKAADRSGSPNDFTSSGANAYGLIASPDNDFPIMNEMSRDYTGWDFDNGGLKISTNDTSTTQTQCCASRLLPKTGKWWYEVKLLELCTTSSGGAGNEFGFNTTGARELVRWSYGHNGSANGNTISSAPSAGTQTIGSGGSTGYPSANDWYAFGADLDNGTFVVYKNGAQIGTTYSYDFNSTTDRFVPYFKNDEGVSGRGSSTEFNFGQGISVTSNSGAGHTDGNGFGKFQYAPPTGYLSICDANVPNPTIVPSEHFNVVTYNGNVTDNRAITLGFQPDLIISKRSQSSASWYWIDSIRGSGRPLASNSTGPHGNETNQVKSFTSTGITVGTDSNINGSGTNGYMLYGWKGGGTAVSNTDGSLTSTVSVNTTAGFSVVKYTVPSSGTWTWGHGLGKKPDCIIIKGDYDGAQGNTYNWDVYTPDNDGTGGAGYRLVLNSSGMRETHAQPFRVEPTSTVVSQGPGWYDAGSNNIAYCWNAVEGYSSFGYYNGISNSHVMILTGFQPKFVVVKPITGNAASTGWRVFDKVRSPNNNQGSDNAMYWNTNAAQVGQNGVDLHSNGFSVYGEGDVNINASGTAYFYMAFAELPAEFARGTG